MKLAESIERYLVYISTERRLAKRTVQIYSENLALFCQYMEQQHITDTADLSTTDVRQWLQYLTERYHQPTTVRYHLSPVRSWYRYLMQNQVVSTDIMRQLPMPRLSKHLPVFFREQELNLLYSPEGPFANTFQGVRDRTLLRLLYETGMRRAELLSLKEQSVDMSARTIKIHGKRDKDRIVPLEDELLQNIRAYLTLKHEQGWTAEALFVDAKDGEALSPSQVYRIVKRYMSGSSARRVSPHVFRHSFATHLLNEGANIEAIKELLGHSDLSTTEVYTHVTREHLKDTYKHTHPRALNDTDNTNL